MLGHIPAALVTLGVRYGAKTVVVSWSLGKDMKGQAADWIGFYKLGQPNTKYRQYIKTGALPPFPSLPYTFKAVNVKDRTTFPPPRLPASINSSTLVTARITKLPQVT